VDLALKVVSLATAGVVCYYFLLFLVSQWTTRRTPRTLGDDEPFFVIVVPAHDEELVIAQTITRLRTLHADRFLVLVVNDGSRDHTAEVARMAASGDRRVVVVDRVPALAGQGKGEVLNHAYRLISALVRWGDSRLAGAGPDRVVVGIVDADGWLEPHALRTVAPYFADQRVGAVQLPVRIWNARENFLTRMQDIEFIGFSLFVQAGRDPTGSVGLGGNGQFSRLSALQELGKSPWSRCLTEDLDLGLRLVERGWRNRFCPHACVAQQALTAFRPFYRQRTRWIQGHYSCWQHLPALWRSANVPLATKIDLSLYLTLVAFILVLAVQFTIGVMGYLGLTPWVTNPLQFVGDEHLQRVATLALSITPLLAFAVTYQRFSVLKLPVWALPGVFAIFALYGYLWAVPASLRALSRIALRRGSWTKTPRTPISDHDLRGERPALIRVG
jgi:cellulose synthase/poly-beta-1,6-N-acetylglucosamine synthase-like glycosyltransferase